MNAIPKYIFILLVAIIAGCSSPLLRGAQIVTASIEVTALPVDADTVTINGNVLTWKDTVAAAATQIDIGADEGFSATNLFNHVVNYPITGLSPGFSDTNIVTLRTTPATTVTVTSSGSWATITYSTNTLTQSAVVRVPATSIADTGSTNRAFIFSGVVKGISDYNTELLEMPDGSASAPAYSFKDEPDTGMFSTAANQLEFATGGTRAMYFDSSQAAHFAGDINGTSGGLLQSFILSSPTTTNLVNYGDAISSRGSAGTNSEQFGDDANASSNGATAVGDTAVASALNATALGYFSEATGAYSTGLGNSADASGDFSLSVGTSSTASADLASAFGVSSTASGYVSMAIGGSSTASGGASVALGSGATASNTNSMAIGVSATASHDNSIVVGNSVTSTAANQVLIGSATQTVVTAGNLDIDGELLPATVNALSYAPFSNSSLANGNNAAVNISTNSFVRIASGPTAAFTINGIAGGSSGRLVTIYNATAQNMTIANDSGVDATAANRIYTLTGSDYSTTGTGAVTLIYDATASRWVLISARD